MLQMIREERKDSMKEKINVSEIFGSHVFNDSVMKARLPKAVYKDLKRQSKKEQN